MTYARFCFLATLVSALCTQACCPDEEPPPAKDAPAVLCEDPAAWDACESRSSLALPVELYPLCYPAGTADVMPDPVTGEAIGSPPIGSTPAWPRRGGGCAAAESRNMGATDHVAPDKWREWCCAPPVATKP